VRFRWHSWSKTGSSISSYATPWMLYNVIIHLHIFPSVVE
jgi:hypothetical protein